MLTSTQRELREYCARYFDSVGATFHSAPPETLCVELPRDVDKELTDRPFYWMWVEAMNEDPPNTVLYLKFHPDTPDTDVPENAKPELLTPGCYRMLRILASARSRGAFAAAYEPASVLTPYALFVVKVSYVSDLRRDFLESYVVDLRDCRVYGDAMEKLTTRALQDERPLNSRILPVPLNIDQVFHLISQCVQLDVQERDHTWAKEAKQRLNAELIRLDRYYASIIDSADADPDHLADNAAERELRKAEIIWRTEPKIEVRPTQFAIVYLASPPV